MKDLVKQLPINLLPVLIGVLAFFIVVGPRALNPQNIAWLGNGDPATHYLGWVFFRQSPWTFPIGHNPSYGLELSNGIIFSDSNPLLAFLFKPFASLLPTPFQYFGLWFLACFVLQAWFAWKLVGLVSTHVGVRAVSTALFLFVPPMLMRMPFHLSLGGHFLVLASLYLALHPQLRRRRLAWGALLAAAALIHAYFLAMVAVIWIADLTSGYFKKKLTLQPAAIELIGLFSLVTVCCWQAGYFSVGSEGAISAGFGLYAMNLLSLIDPGNWAGQWSYVLKDLPGVQGLGEVEGFLFLGLGLMTLGICALVGLLQGRTGFFQRLRRWPLLLVALVGLGLFSISNHVALGSLDITFPLPPWVISIANVFRASGRMFWPLYYAFIFAMIFLVIRANTSRTAVSLLSLALLIQVLDTHAGWAGVRKQLMVEPASKWASPMVDPFWNSAAAHYRNIRWVVPQNQSPNWMAVADFASAHGLATNAVYLGRVDTGNWIKSGQDTGREMASGKYDADSLYLFDDRAWMQAVRNVNTPTDLFARIDGFTVLAPGWKQCSACTQATSQINPLELVPSLEPGQKTLFNTGSKGGALLAKGWSDTELWGTWSKEPEAEVMFRVPAPVHSLRLEATAFLPPGHARQRVAISINDLPAMNTLLEQADGNVIEMPLTTEMQARVASQGVLRLQFQFADAVSPKQFAMGQDVRQLALGLKALTVN
ncbi:DUF6311 domain-containing protein [Pseudomonas sp. B21-040]|uniref:DUF6311 domain-containing protein n=1 Tax=unclassified Pseudomonas TaxID=196821 RepID=UPI001CC03DEA|nr:MULTISPECIES: DUF6311 domain-containing protein [unclassified Pseudomonas]UVL41793.1 DUF6311 domain-containing protein [Pseudomonas sp. B21-040]